MVFLSIRGRFDDPVNAGLNLFHWIQVEHIQLRIYPGINEKKFCSPCLRMLI